MFKNTQTLNWWTGLDWIYLRTLLLLEHLAVLKRTTMMTEEYMLTTMTFVYDETVHLYSHETQELTCTLRNVDKDGEESRGRAASNNLRAQLTVILF